MQTLSLYYTQNEYSDLISNPRLAPEIDEYVTKMLIVGGITPRLKGFHYLKDCLLLTYFNPKFVHQITKGLYPAIANIYKTSSDVVEHAIRTAVYKSATSGKLEAVNELIGISYFKKGYNVTNAEIIALLSERIKPLFMNRWKNSLE